MITNSKEYYSLLYAIQDQNNLYRTAHQEPPIPIPENEPTLKIDLNKRVMETPETLGVQHDHYSETVFFEVDRYYNDMDLATTTCIIEYENKTTQKSRIYMVPYYDIITDENQDEKILFPWCISGEATREAGIVEYAIKFYKIANTMDDIYEVLFILNIQPARSKVLKGMGSATLPEDYDVAADALLALQHQIDGLAKKYEMYWLTVE